MISLLENISKVLTFSGLLTNFVGVITVYLYSKRIASENLSFFEAQRWHYFKKMVDWGIRLVVVGSGLQLVGALIDLLKA